MEVNLICKSCGFQTKRILGSVTCTKCGGNLVRRTKNIEKRNIKAKQELADLYNR